MTHWPGLLDRGAYILPLLDAHGRRFAIVVDRRGRYQHTLSAESGETPQALLQRAWAYLDMIDPPVPQHS